MKSFVVLLFVVGMMYSQESLESTILLKNGDKVSGTIVSQNDSVVVVKTSFGEVTIPKNSIKPQSITLYLKDGNVISGEIVSRNDSNFILTTTFGVVTIDKNNVDRTTESGMSIPGTRQKDEFYYSNERLIDIFFDPTGYTMEKGSIYFSGLSWGVAISDNIDISSSYWRYFLADLNIRPKFQLMKSGNIESENALSVGFHFHSAGYTGKQQFKTTRTSYVDYFTNTTVYQEHKNWEDVGSIDDYTVWNELFIAFTNSQLKDDRKGRVAYHVGASLILHKITPMPRAWVAIENDITSRFKIIGQLYYDPFLPSYRERSKHTNTKNPFDLDFGFVYAHNENLRVGIHYQPYIVLFYFKF